jgi:poly-gamma-glutamate synthesis protein (capsule biosynthesis protein)
VTVANLESPLTDEGTRHPTKPIVFRGRPTNVTGLSYAGIDVVSLANNHIIDYGLVGMRETQRMCDSVGVAHSGAGANSYEAYLPLFRQAKGQSIALLAACDRNGQYDNYQPYLDAGYNKSGFAYLDSFHLREQIEQVRDRADIVVCELHTGEEYTPAPGEGSGRVQGAECRVQSAEPRNEEEMYSPWQRFPAPGDTAERHRLIDYGADAVICHHPHMLQGFEVYRNRLIAHSLGDFAFDLNYPECFPSAILTGYWDERGFYEYRVVPVYVDDWIPRTRPLDSRRPGPAVAGPRRVSHHAAGERGRHYPH